MTEHERVARGHRAFNELQEVNAAFDQVEAVLVRELTQAPVGADVKILRLHMSLQNLAAIRLAVRNIIDDGLMADSCGRSTT